MNDPEFVDRLAIRDLVENWVLWRDAGDWERFRTVWHDDGWMMATWTQGSADHFIKMSVEGWDKGVSILHFLGGTHDRSRRQPRHRPDQDDDLAARQGAWRPVRCRLHGPLLRFRREAAGQVGRRAAPADLREGPPRSGRSRCQARARPGASSPRCPRATGIWATCSARSAIRSRPTCRASRARGRGALCPRQGLAGGRPGALTHQRPRGVPSPLTTMRSSRSRWRSSVSSSTAPMPAMTTASAVAPAKQEHDQDLILGGLDRIGAGQDLARHHAGQRDDAGRRHGVEDRHHAGAQRRAAAGRAWPRSAWRRARSAPRWQPARAVAVWPIVSSTRLTPVSVLPSTMPRIGSM